jgi:ribosomal-protein-alanine acetyltransferase
MNHAGIHLREASLERDLEKVMQIERDSFNAWDAFPSWEMTTLMNPATGLFLIAEYDGTIAGYLSLTICRRHNTGHVYSLAVSPAYRRLHLADALMERAIACAREKRLRAVFLEVRTDNAVAIRLYEKKGFMRRFTKQSYYSDGDPAYCMTLSLREQSLP